MTQRLHRYTFPFKPMRVPPAHENMFKYKKGAARLNEWITAGGQAVEGLRTGSSPWNPRLSSLRHPEQHRGMRAPVQRGRELGLLLLKGAPRGAPD